MSRKERNLNNLPKAIFSKPVEWIHPRYGRVSCSMVELLRRFPQCGLKVFNLLAVYNGHKLDTCKWKLYLN